MDDPILCKLAMLSAKNALSLSYHDENSYLLPLMLLMPRLVSETQEELMQKIDDQWKVLPTKAMLLNNIADLEYSNNSADILWSRLKKSGSDFQELSDSALGVLSLPHSNADCERVFSCVNAIKTKYRNRQLTETIYGTLLAKECIKGGRRGTKNCNIFVPSADMLSRMTTSSVLYPSNNSNDEVNDHNVTITFSKD